MVAANLTALEESMLDLIQASHLQQFTTHYEPGATLFLEGDPTTDLYILVAGSLDILKGPKKISELNEPGALFGEMSFLLGEQRTATVVADSPVTAIRIPGEQITEVVKEFPDFGLKVAALLAKRLQNTTTMAYGLKEFCDQLPDAVMITTDQDQKVLAWNAAAERLYGRTAEEMRDLSLQDLYSDQQAYAELQENVQQRQPANCKEMPIHLPGGEDKMVSTSTTVLYDGHYNVQGLLFLSRDVTKLHELEKKYRKIRNWLIPAGLLLALIAGSLFWALPRFTRGTQILDYKKQSFRQQIHTGLTELARQLNSRTTTPIQDILAAYYTDHNLNRYGVQGILLLNGDKTVTAAYLATTDADKDQLLGSSYGAISFPDRRDGQATILNLFRTTASHPMGKEFHELAWRLENRPQSRWLVFQLDMDWLKKEFGIDSNTLHKLRFDSSQ